LAEGFLVGRLVGGVATAVQSSSDSSSVINFMLLVMIEMRRRNSADGSDLVYVVVKIRSGRGSTLTIYIHTLRSLKVIMVKSLLTSL
jgi:hypothetical protein